jgi:1-deoxy-D-xylulose 5-phosphate reductoisomerase
VHAFLDETIPFTAIPDIIEAVLDDIEARGASAPTSLDDVRAVDAAARELSCRLVREVQSTQ